MIIFLKKIAKKVKSFQGVIHFCLKSNTKKMTLVLVGKINNVYISGKALDTTLYSPAVIIYRQDFINCRPTKKNVGALAVCSF